MMKNNNVYIFIFSVIFGFILSAVLMKRCSNTPNVKEIDTVTITDTLWKDTTIIEKQLVPKKIVEIKRDTVYKSNGDTLELVTEAKRYDRSLTSDKDTCDLEIYTTGINTSLDSLKWRLKTHSVTNTIEITKYIEKKKKLKDRIHLEPQIGLGYGVFKKNVDMYVGFGVGIDLW